MRVIIAGGCGFLGQRLTKSLLARGGLTGWNGPEPIDEIVLFDRVTDDQKIFADEARVRIVNGDITDREGVFELIRSSGDGSVSVFHLTAVMSGIAEKDIELGYRINLGGLFNVLDAARTLRQPPRFVFASTVGVFGGSSMPPIVSDRTKQAPQTSYGAAKAMGELLVNDYTRKGFIDGRGARLPAIIIRPGAPFAGAGSFASDVFREPLKKRACVLPVGLDTAVAVLGYRDVVEYLIRLHELDAQVLGDDRIVNLPNLQCDLKAMITALGLVAEECDLTLGQISIHPDPNIERIVFSWPIGMEFDRASAIDFPAPSPLSQVIKDFLADFP